MLGVNAGYGFGTSTWSTSRAVKISPKGMLVGGTAGYNWQAGAIVYGLEGDFDWSDVKGSVACGPAGTCETEHTGSARSAAASATPSTASCPSHGRRRLRQRQGHRAPVRRGFVGVQRDASSAGPVGAGLEYAFLGNWTAKLEYLYVDLGKLQLRRPARRVDDNVTFKESIVRAGLNYKFSGPIFSRF